MVFGKNLRELSGQAQSVAQLCRDLQINRTQFNRYLSGEAFPRPDVLSIICEFFDVDARILLEPLSDLRQKNAFDQHRRTLAGNPFSSTVDRHRLPAGAYLLYRPSRIRQGEVAINMCTVKYTTDSNAIFTTVLSQGFAKFIGLSTRLVDRRMSSFVTLHGTGCSFTLLGSGATLRHFGFVEFSYRGNPNFYTGETLTTQRFGEAGDLSDPIMIERLESGYQAMLAARRRLGSQPFTQMPPIVQSFFLSAVKKRGKVLFRE